MIKKENIFPCTFLSFFTFKIIGACFATFSLDFATNLETLFLFKYKMLQK